LPKSETLTSQQGYGLYPELMRKAQMTSRHPQFKLVFNICEER